MDRTPFHEAVIAAAEHHGRTAAERELLVAGWQHAGAIMAEVWTTAAEREEKIAALGILEANGLVRVHRIARDRNGGPAFLQYVGVRPEEIPEAMWATHHAYWRDGFDRMAEEIESRRKEEDDRGDR